MTLWIGFSSQAVVQHRADRDSIAAFVGMAG